jgi:hypothetical protein
MRSGFGFAVAALLALSGAAAAQAGTAPTSSPEQYAAEIVREDALWGPLVKSLNLKVE